MKPITWIKRWNLEDLKASVADDNGPEMIVLEEGYINSSINENDKPRFEIILDMCGNGSDELDMGISLSFSFDNLSKDMQTQYDDFISNFEHRIEFKEHEFSWKLEASIQECKKWLEAYREQMNQLFFNNKE